MSRLLSRQSEFLALVLKQLNNFWSDTNPKVIELAMPQALNAIEVGFHGIPSSRFFNGEEIVFSPYFSVHWMIFLYRLSNAIYRLNIDTPPEADQLYYLNKIMHANDWLYAINLPPHFLCEHPLGSVLGRAEYGDYLFVYQGTTVGGNRKNGRLFYPTLGDNVVLFANATVLGNTHVGNNVIISANTYLMNEVIPDNCLVFGKSPDIIIKHRTEDEMTAYFERIWGKRDNAELKTRRGKDN